MIFLDANILVSAVFGKHTRKAVLAAAERGVRLGITEAQLGESAKVLVEKLSFSQERAAEALGEVVRLLVVALPPSYAIHEQAARERLHARAQPDWPLLAAAMASNGAIWSHDRDFFGVGVPVWSTRNLQFAET